VIAHVTRFVAFLQTDHEAVTNRGKESCVPSSEHLPFEGGQPAFNGQAEGDSIIRKAKLMGNVVANCIL
jgi:hypothetical protein